MCAKEAIQRKIPVGEIVKPWLMMGPIYRDVSDEVVGLTLFEGRHTTNGQGVLRSYVEEAEAILASEPREGEAGVFAGEAGRWDLVRRPEKVLMWGRYNISNHLVAGFLTARVRPEKAGPAAFRLLMRISSRAQVYLNGKRVFDTEGAQVAGRGGTFEYRFEAELKAGDNVLNVGLFRIGRMAQVGMRLECDQALTVKAPVHGGLSEDQRAKVEGDVQALRLEKDIFYDAHTIGVRLARPLESGARLVCRLMRGGKAVKTVRRQPKGAGLVRICRGSDVPDGGYELVCEFVDGEGRTITGVVFNLIVITPTQPMTGYRKMAQRKQITLEYSADAPAGNGRVGIWKAVAQYALGREVDEEAIRRTCEFIDNRLDCADFAIQGVLRLAYWDHERGRLSPEIRTMMKNTFLGFKYWVDEPGDTVMYMGSENHRLLFHVAEYLAGQLYPTEEFTNSRQRGLYHVTKARMFLMEWMRQRGRFGFDEWHSNSYYPINISPLLNLYDFPLEQDYALRHLAGNVLHYMFFNLAADTFHGVFGTTHGRSYARNLIHPDMEGTSATCWLLFGEGSLHGGAGMSPVCLATSRYALPEVIERIALDRKTVTESRQQQGALMRASSTANFVVYRTPDYLMSGLQDHRKGEYESSSHVAQVTFEDKTVVFFSCPHTCGEGGGLRPDYWSGHTTLPRVIQHQNVMSLSWRLSEFAWMTHCFFEQDRFDEVVYEGKWVFARKHKGYLAIWSQNGMTVGDYGQYAGRELVCDAPENTWIVECGREADWGSFEAFAKAMKAAEIKATGETVTYESPSIGRFVTGWDVQPTVAGAPVQTRDYPLLESAFGKARYGSGEMTLRCGAEKLDLYFNF